ncbi:hypothetical protein ACIBCD_26950 [Nocardia brasiliensis]|uniref:hypothetical protein n=1 Tax=Nocardia brasiliensis TaxID=37326 RepID=UPI00379407EF
MSTTRLRVVTLPERSLGLATMTPYLLVIDRCSHELAEALAVQAADIRTSGTRQRGCSTSVASAVYSTSPRATPRMRSRLLDLVDRLITKLAQRIADRIAPRQRADAPTMTDHIHIGDDATRRMAEYAVAQRRTHHHYR